MKVYVLPADAYGCGHYRLIWPANILQNQGYDVVIMPPNQKSGFLARTGEKDDGTQELLSVQVPEDADVIVLQRPAHRLQPQMIQMMRANGIAVVVDMDDNMSLIDPNNIAYNVYRHRPNKDLSWKYAKESCKEATLVTTSTRSLQKEYARSKQGVVLDNYVPEAYLDFEHTDTGNFGWAGTTKSHPNDLQVAGNVYQWLIDEGFHFKVVGGPSNVKNAARLKQDVDHTYSIPLQEWVRTIGLEISVGMVPLAASAFNTSKSRLKGIEYMAAGVPWVASAREEYRRLHQESGCGYLVDSVKQWYVALKRLLTDEALRIEEGLKGRAFMADQTYQLNAWRWMTAWEEAFKIERGGTRHR